MIYKTTATLPSFEDESIGIMFDLDRWILSMAPIDHVIDLLFLYHQTQDTKVSIVRRDLTNPWNDFQHCICHTFRCALFKIIPYFLYQPPLSSSSPSSFSSLSSSFVEFLDSIHFQDPALSIQLTYVRKLIIRFVLRLNNYDGHHLHKNHNHSSNTMEDPMDILMDNDNMSYFFLKLNQIKIYTDIPNPDSYCHVSFIMPNNEINRKGCVIQSTVPYLDVEEDDVKMMMMVADATISTTDAPSPTTTSTILSLLRIKIFPYHNDVGVRKVWEAGCCLAEFLYMFPHYIQKKMVFELGSGVGLTGLFIAKFCQPQCTHMTDATNLCLDNLNYNITMNKPWLFGEHENHILYHHHHHHHTDSTNIQALDHIHRIQEFEPSRMIPTTKSSFHGISSGYFNWKDHDIITTLIQDDVFRSPYDESNHLDRDSAVNVSSYHFFQNANVLLAADVLYDRDDIPYLVQTIYSFLSLSSSSTSATGCNNNDYYYKFDKENEDAYLPSNYPKRVAIFATTIRNHETFQLFQQDLIQLKIQSQTIPLTTIENLPKIFPCYFLQPRSDVCITIFTLS